MYIYKSYNIEPILNASEENDVRILLSHIPLLRTTYNKALLKTIKSFGPNIILSAHDHIVRMLFGYSLLILCYIRQKYTKRMRMSRFVDKIL